MPKDFDNYSRPMHEGYHCPMHRIDGVDYLVIIVFCLIALLINVRLLPIELMGFWPVLVIIVVLRGLIGGR
jgi:hypothetical protein